METYTRYDPHDSSFETNKIYFIYHDGTLLPYISIILFYQSERRGGIDHGIYTLCSKDCLQSDTMKRIIKDLKEITNSYLYTIGVCEFDDINVDKLYKYKHTDIFHILELIDVFNDSYYKAKRC
jgi:hypothetical protein